MSAINGVGGSSDAWAQMRSQMQARMFSKVDANGDGGVDKTELKGMLSDISAMSGQNVGGDIDDTFATMDGNGDGKLSSDELGKGMESLMPPPSTMDFAKAMGGKDRSGVAGGAQAASQENNTYDKLDTNQDGTVSEIERLVGELRNASSSKNGTAEGASDAASKQSASFDLAKLVQQMYEQFSAGFSAQQGSKALSALA